VPVEPVLTLIAIAVAINLGVMALVIVPPMVGRASPLARHAPDAPERYDHNSIEFAALAARAPDLIQANDVTRGAYDRVVRVVSWGFILISTVIVAITGLWREVEPAIFVLLALAGLFVLVVHDLIPAGALGPAKFVVEGSVALTFGTILVVLTGRESSPFFYIFPLIVGGAALVVSQQVTIVLAALAGLAYVLGVVAGADEGLTAETAATVGIHLTAMILITYVAMVIAREQRLARDAAIRLSTVDPLTGLFNRTFFFAAIDREIARSARSGRGFCLLMMDLDELKAINDRFGHFEGDRVLRGVGEVIRNGIRRIDTPSRYGGDEFVVLLPETDPTGAYVLAEKIRIGATELKVPGGDIRPSLSIGVVSYPAEGETADALMISADRAMYAAKRAGKDRVVGLRT
jgi:diguanylate cyclase (GGDEF)-like protein